MRKFLIVMVSCFWVACPADGPLDESDDGSRQSDMGTGGGDISTSAIALASVTPSEGPADGGTMVTLTGDGFAAPMTVRFGNTAAVDATVISETEATAITPASPASGAVTVVVSSGGETSSLQSGFTFTGEPAIDAVVSYCRLQAQSPTSATVDSESTQLFAVVFSEGVTQGPGAGVGIEGELGWGAGADVGSFMFTPMVYNVDIDGLTPGDLANDEYGAPLTIPTAGSYRYAARFRYGTQDWVTCDLDGSDNGTTEDQLGVIDVSDTGGLVDACKLQFPNLIEDAEVGAQLDFFGRVTAQGITGSQQPNAALTGQFFIGPVGVDPAADPAAFTMVDATLSASPLGLAAGEDEYTASAAPSAAGEQAFGFRFSLDSGTSWRYCGIADASTPSGTFAPEKLGVLTAGPQDTIDYCHVWQDTMTDDADGANLPAITVEVYEDPVTVDNGGANSAMLEVEAAALPLEVNPALANAEWNALPYKDLRPGVANNYEYEGTPYTSANNPSAGTYNVVARVRRSGDTIWTYCDIDENADEFRLEAASRLTIQ